MRFPKEEVLVWRVQSISKGLVTSRVTITPVSVGHALSSLYKAKSSGAKGTVPAEVVTQPNSLVGFYRSLHKGHTQLPINK